MSYRTWFMAATSGILSGVMLITAQAPTLRVDVPIVSVDVSVADANGRAITNLTREDFIVLEDGVQQEIRNFAPVGTPYNILVLVGNSATTQKYLALFTTAVQLLVQNLRPDDRVAAAVFYEQQVDMISSWRDAVSVSPQAITIPTAFSNINGIIAPTTLTPKPPIVRRGWVMDFYGAVQWAANSSRTQAGRTAVIFLTDTAELTIPYRLQQSPVGGLLVPRLVDAKDDSNFNITMKAARTAGAALYFIVMDTDLNPGPDFSPIYIPVKQGIRSRVEKLADVSGGRVAFPQHIAEILSLYERIGHDLGTAYSLGYTPPQSAVERYRRIEVRAKNQDLRIRQSRSGYSSQ